MSRHSDGNRRKSTIKRDNDVLNVYSEVKNELGELACAVSKSYIYEKIHERTGLCTKTIAFIINHVDRRK